MPKSELRCIILNEFHKEVLVLTKTTDSNLKETCPGILQIMQVVAMHIAVISGSVVPL